MQSVVTSAIVASRMRHGRRPVPALSLVLVGLALAGFILAAASIPHSHALGRPGLYNQEHDLSYLATFGGGAPLPEAPSAAPLVVLVVLALVAATDTAPILWRRHADFRAPPLR